MKPLPILILLAVIYSSCSPARKDFTQFVNPFIGTDGTGHSFPGPSLPFGMVQPGPDNRDIGWDYTSGYQYKDSLIMGFSQNRANGTGISEFGDILLMPFTSVVKDSFASKYTKSSEKASPGYYSVILDNNIKVELSCTQRVALHRYIFPSTEQHLLVDLQHGLRFLTDSLVLDSKVAVENNNSISGYCHTRNWVERKYFFHILFEQPFSSYRQLERRPGKNAPRYVLDFNGKQKVLQVKLALSTVNVEGAKKNMEKELPGWDLDGVVEKARDEWNNYLGRIEIEAPMKQRRIFYSCLYRLFLQPSNIADVDGKYRGPDDSVRQAKNGEYYSTLSLWDTYRAAHPLYTLIAPEKVDGFINTMIEHSKAAGFLPIWTAWGKDNYCMIGNHAIPVIADAYKKGFRGFDAEEALRQMIRTTTEDHINSNWKLLDKFGYYPFDSLDNESVSRTLEHGVDDHCVAMMADAMGRMELAAVYDQRASRYKTLFDPGSRQMRGKDSKGNWRANFDPLKATSPMNNPGDYTEANAWQYFWTPAQYDVIGMTGLLGGAKELEKKLDSFFAIQSNNPNKHLGQEAMIGQYAHGNEPSHHIAYLYAFTEAPEKARQLIGRICGEFYGDGPEGMIGNDDCGQMSAWYILSTLGFYQVDPADGRFIVGMPQAASIKVKLGQQYLQIRSTGDINFQKLLWRGDTVKQRYLEYHELMKGGELLFQ